MGKPIFILRFRCWSHRRSCCIWAAQSPPQRITRFFVTTCVMSIYGIIKNYDNNNQNHISEKMRESRLRWYGHIMRRDENHPVRRALSIPERPKGRGRPPATWWSNVQNEIRKQNIEPQTTRSRTLWRKFTRRPDPK
ncbi:hypothetical protein ABMA27_015620 [Loxostege sticticalis]|uniref:Uncharacterized protein n=1 Tax=Loxostege sticticalis TaxID=481309 RepID=A0ABR3I8D2_LOXSC